MKEEHYKIKILDLFSGIGGFSLAGHWLGWETVGFVEWDKYCQKVLEKNFPGVPIHGDIKTFKGNRYAADVIVGGFPCQPFSTAGQRKGATDNRYLWPEMLRVIREVQPSWIVAENVAGLASMAKPVCEPEMVSKTIRRNSESDLYEAVYTQQEEMLLHNILQEIENEGYRVQVLTIPDCAVEAPHRRDRIWIIAHSNRTNERRTSRRLQQGQPVDKPCSTDKAYTPFTDSNSIPGWTKTKEGLDMARDILEKGQQEKGTVRCKQCDKPIIANSESSNDRRPGGKEKRRQAQESGECVECGVVTNATGEGLQRSQQPNGKERQESHDKQLTRCYRIWDEHWFEVATRLCRMDDGLPSWVDANRTPRLKALGNSIVPQVAYEILKAIDELHFK